MLPEKHTTRSTSSLSRKQHQRATSAAQQARQQLQSDPVPYWAEPLPLPPEIDFEADVQSDLKVVALIAAIKEISQQRGTSIPSQLDAWNYGRGAL